MGRLAGQTETQCLPDSLVIGPQKAGTTWIYRYFQSRGDIGVPRGVKETFFFDRRYGRGIRWYGRHFRREDGKRRVVEVAPTYFHCPEAPNRILEHLGSIPLVCTLRHPGRRAFSLYLNMRRYGLTRAGFREAVARHPNILESSRYATNLKRWITTFGPEKILVLFLDKLSADPDGYAGELCRHLGLPDRRLDRSLYQPVNEAALPRDGRVARVAYDAAELARSMRLYPLVEAAKKIGLKEMFFGRPGGVEVPRLGNEDCDWFTARILEEIEELECLLGVDLPGWKSSGDVSPESYPAAKE